MAEPWEKFQTTVSNAPKPWEKHQAKKSDLPSSQPIPDFQNFGELQDFTQSLPDDDPRKAELLQAVTAQQEKFRSESPITSAINRFTEATGLNKLSSAGESIQQALPEPPAALSEFSAAALRAPAAFADSLTVDLANDIKQRMGFEPDIPTMKAVLGAMGGNKDLEGGFMEEGLAKDVVNTAGEMSTLALGSGAALRNLASKAPAITGSSSTGQGVLKQLGSSTAAQDVGYTGLSAYGAELGEEVGGEEGKLIGSVLLPATYAGASSPLKKIFSMGKDGISKFTTSLSQLSDDGAATLLAEQMIREGMGPDDVAKRLVELGPDAIPADVSNSFGRLLKAATNKIPHLEGKATLALNQRQLSSPGRVADSLDSVSVLNVDDQIKAYQLSNGPKVKELYDKVRAQPLKISPRLKGLFGSDNSVSRAMKKAEIRLADKRAAGERISHIDIVDSTKQELDDQIGAALRKGENNKVRDLVKLKNIMVDEADKAIPEYKQARDLFAGDRQLESAADAGRNYFKLKPREVTDFIQSMGASERKMFQLGAKEAIEDKIQSTNTSSDIIKRLFGKNGDILKLKNIFDSPAKFNKFKQTMEQEAQFALTRRAAQGNSTTFKQAQHVVDAEQALSAASAMMGNPAEAANTLKRIVSKLTGNRTEAQVRMAFEQAGDILLASGMKPEKLQAILRRGNAKLLETELSKVLLKPAPSFAGPTLRAATAQELTDE